MSKKFLTACALTLPAIGVFAEEVKWPVPPSGYASANASIPKGTLGSVRQYPTAKYNNRPVRVYTPPGYSATRAEKYPVLYLHHGIGGDESAWTNGAEGNADKVMDFLYAQSSLNVTPMVVVMPRGFTVDVSGDVFGRSPYFGEFEDVLMKDLIPYIEANFNVSTDRTMRAIAGLSMGGGQTLNFGYKYPTTFNWIGAFSPAPNTTAAGTTIKDLPAVKANIRLNFLAAGTAESDYLNRARTYHNWLNSNGVTNLYLQVEQGLNHEKENWNRQLHNFAQRIFKGVPTEIIQTPKKTVAKGGDGRIVSSRFLVSRGAADGISTAIFTLDGKALPANALPSLPPQR